MSLGGDHTIALPLLRAMHRQHGPIALIHFDAHLDTWDTYFGAPYTHGTPFRRAWEEGLLRPGHCGHVGIRASLYSPQNLVDDAEMGFTIVRSSDFEEHSIASRGRAAPGTGSVTRPCTCRSTSTSSIRRMRPAPAPPRAAA